MSEHEEIVILSKRLLEASNDVAILNKTREVKQEFNKDVKSSSARKNIYTSNLELIIVVFI